MSTSSLRINLNKPQTLKINLPEQVRYAIGMASPVPYGTAKISIDTTENWSNRLDYIPQKGEIVIYSDRRIIGDTPYPGIKIGDGKAYCIDLPFLGDDNTEIILNSLNWHINNFDAHIRPGEREKWNNKISCSIDGERLIFEGDGI